MAKRGRPTTYTKEKAEAICAMIAGGKSLRAALREAGIDGETWYRWLEAQDGLSEQYARVQEIRAELISDEIIELADTPREMERQVPGGGSFTIDEVNRSRLQVDARKWVACKLYPRKYGDRVQTELTGRDGGAIELTLVVEDAGGKD